MEGETEVQIFWQGKAQNSSPILRCTFLARRSAKLIANFSATMVTSLPSFSLCISLSLSLSHRMYLTHNIGNASAFPYNTEREREREREKDGSYVTIVALKLAMSFALLLAKNVHLSIGGRSSFALFLAKKFAPRFLPS